MGLLQKNAFDLRSKLSGPKSKQRFRLRLQPKNLFRPMSKLVGSRSKNIVLGPPSPNGPLRNAPGLGGRNAIDNVVPGPRCLTGGCTCSSNIRSGEVEFQTSFDRCTLCGISDELWSLYTLCPGISNEFWSPYTLWNFRRVLVAVHSVPWNFRRVLVAAHSVEFQTNFGRMSPEIRRDSSDLD